MSKGDLLRRRGVCRGGNIANRRLGLFYSYIRSLLGTCSAEEAFVEVGESLCVAQ
jgi:hypothetical protein